MKWVSYTDRKLLLGTESRLRRGVKGGRKISTDSVSPTCFGCLQFAKCNFFSFHESDLRSRIAERKPKNQRGHLEVRGKLEAYPTGQDRFYSANDSSGQYG